MINHFVEYAAERLGAITIEEEYGFVQYVFTGDGEGVYIAELYVAPAFRGAGFGPEHPYVKLTEKVISDAKTKGCKRLLAKIVPSLPHVDKIMGCHLRYGMKISGATQDAIWTYKEI